LLHVIKPELVNPFGKDFPDWKLNNQNSTTIDVDQAPTFESLQMLMLISGGQGISISFVGISFLSNLFGAAQSSLGRAPYNR
jgi:hypothetical protein